MTTLIQVTAQVEENYNFFEGGQHWKPKNGQMFTLRADSDDFCYDEENCVKVIQLLLDKQSNDHTRYTYISHELIFQEPIELDSSEFDTLLKEEYMKGKSVDADYDSETRAFEGLAAHNERFCD